MTEVDGKYRKRERNVAEGKKMSNGINTLKEEARKAKLRLKKGFWTDCKEDMGQRMQQAREQGVNESKAGRYFAEQVTKQIAGVKEDDFYLRVKEMLLAEGEVSDAIGRLTDGLRTSRILIRFRMKKSNDIRCR